MGMIGTVLVRAAAVAMIATSLPGVALGGTNNAAQAAVAATETPCVPVDRKNIVPPVPTIPNAKTARHKGYRFKVDYPPAWFDGSNMTKVAAGGVIDAVTLREAQLKPTDTLKNVEMNSKTSYPTFTVYRFPKVNDSAEAVATRMVTFLQARGVKTGAMRTWCLDGAPAEGFAALTAAGSFQDSWFTIHGGDLYYLFFIAKTDGTHRSQSDLLVTSTSIRVTWKWV